MKSRAPITLLAVVTAALAGVFAPAGHTSSAHAADASGNKVVLAVGDMACDTSDPNFNGGAGTSTHCAEQRVSNRMATETSRDAVLGLGDYQYSCSDPKDWQVSYDQTYGQFDSIINPIAGNHEYNTGTDPYGSPCPTDNATATTYFTHFGEAAHQSTGGHYTVTLGNWLIIGLNAECSKTGVGGCGATSPQTKWLNQQLTGVTQPCILAMWHQPRWWSGGNAKAYGPWWQSLYNAGADVVLNGHVHNYQRFKPLNPSGVEDPAGITEYIVGTGGEAADGIKAATTIVPAAKAKAFGYLKMTLYSSSWSAEFIDSSGVVLDTSSGNCH
jgi:Calcineurin-like phosphoesterase